MITEQRKLFINEFIRLRCKNQAQAAINAGYSEKTAHSQASNMMKNSEVIKYLELRKSEIQQELQEEFIFDAIQARKVMFNIMNKDEAEDRDKINVAKDFLDRAGFKAIDKQEITGKDGEAIEVNDARQILIEKIIGKTE